MKKQLVIIAILFLVCSFYAPPTNAQVGSGSGVPDLKDEQRNALLIILAESQKIGAPLFDSVANARAEIEQNFISNKLAAAEVQKHKVAQNTALCKLLALRWDAAIQMMKLLTPRQKQFVVQMIEQSNWEKDAYRVLLDAYQLPDIQPQQ